MLNSKTFPLSTLNSFSLLSSSFMSGPISYLSSTASSLTINTLFKQQRSQSLNSTSPPTHAINNNTMQQEVKWFNKRRLYEAIVKIIILFIFQSTLYSIGVCSFLTLISLFMVVVIQVALNHGIFQGSVIENWAKVSLFVGTTLLVNQIFTYVLNYMAPRKLQLAFQTNFTLIPSFLISVILTLIYTLSPFITNNISTLLTNSIKSLAFNYLDNLKQYLKNIYNFKSILFQVYAAVFLVLYGLVVVFSFDQILFRSQAYLALIQPEISLAQALTVCIFIFGYHFVLYFIGFYINQIKPSFYKTVNKNTKIPLIIQLLKVAPTYQIIQQLQSQNLYINYSIFAKYSFPQQNNLTISSLHKIYITSLSWIKNRLIYKQDNLNSKIYIYNTTGCNDAQYKIVTSYWEYFKQFTNTYLRTTVKVLEQLSIVIAEMIVLRQNKKTIAQDLFYEARWKKMEFKLWYKLIKCKKYLYLCGKIFQILCLANINLSQQIGTATDIVYNIKRIREIAKRIEQISWMNQNVKQRMHEIANKINGVLKKSNVNDK